jgi:hypothetical protein
MQFLTQQRNQWRPKHSAGEAEGNYRTRCRTRRPGRRKAHAFRYQYAIPSGSTGANGNE